MKSYAIEFQAVKVIKESITCTTFIHAEALFLALHQFEEQNRGLGYIAVSVREEAADELSAIKSLKANVRFWFIECDLNSAQIICQVNAWYNFAFTQKEQDAAKKEIIEQINKRR